MTLDCRECNVTVAQKRRSGSKFRIRRKHFLFNLPNTHKERGGERMSKRGKERERETLMVKNKVFCSVSCCLSLRNNEWPWTKQLHCLGATPSLRAMGCIALFLNTTTIYKRKNKAFHHDIIWKGNFPKPQVLNIKLQQEQQRGFGASGGRYFPPRRMINSTRGSAAFITLVARRLVSPRGTHRSPSCACKCALNVNLWDGWPQGGSHQSTTKFFLYKTQTWTDLK